MYLWFLLDSEDKRKSISPVTPSLDAELYRAIANYEAQEDGQISFEEDQLIHVIDKMEDGEYRSTKSDWLKTVLLSANQISGISFKLWCITF